MGYILEGLSSKITSVCLEFPKLKIILNLTNRLHIGRIVFKDNECLSCFVTENVKRHAIWHSHQ